MQSSIRVDVLRSVFPVEVQRGEFGIVFGRRCALERRGVPEAGSARRRTTADWYRKRNLSLPSEASCWMYHCIIQVFVCVRTDVVELGGDAACDDVSVWVQRAHQAEENLSRAMEDLHKIRSGIYRLQAVTRSWVFIR